MNILIITTMVVCFLNSLWWLVAKLTTHLLFKFIFRTLGLIGTVFPILYFLKIFGII